MSIHLLYKVVVGYKFSYKPTTNIFRKSYGYWWKDGALER